MRKRRVVGRIYRMKYSWNDHKDRNRRKNGIKRSRQARPVYGKDINRNIPATWRWARGDSLQGIVNMEMISVFSKLPFPPTGEKCFACCTCYTGMKWVLAGEQLTHTHIPLWTVWFKCYLAATWGKNGYSSLVCFVPLMSVSACCLLPKDRGKNSGLCITRGLQQQTGSTYSVSWERQRHNVTLT